MTGPPQQLIASLVDGPSIVTAVQWHPQCDSTNAEALRAAEQGAQEGLLVLADEQTHGRGRHGRSWAAPAGTSLLLSLLLRPPGPPRHQRLLPLLAGLVLAETVSRHAPDTAVAVKWPNDLLLGGAKAAGILAEAAGDAVVVGVGVNVDWRSGRRPAELSDATSLAEATGRDVDRWRVLAGLLGVFSQRYDDWQQEPTAFLDDYRRRCVTLRRRVRVTGLDGSDMEGEAVDVDDDGALVVRTADGVAAVTAGDVHHITTG